MINEVRLIANQIAQLIASSIATIYPLSECSKDATPWEIVPMLSLFEWLSNVFLVPVLAICTQSKTLSCYDNTTILSILVHFEDLAKLTETLRSTRCINEQPANGRTTTYAGRCYFAIRRNFALYGQRSSRGCNWMNDIFRSCKSVNLRIRR